jgi:poly(hydroxyalkanoate) depolymerase family esterase
MRGIDWRELYAKNQAAIARASVPARDASRPQLSATLPHSLPGMAPAAGHRSEPRANGRRTLVHVPHGLDPGIPAAVICMLHGCTQDPATFAAATSMNDAADQNGFVVVYPGQDRGRNPQGCWNWFVPEHQQRGAGEPETIAMIVRELIETDSRCTIDPERVFVAGLSSGGAMAVILAACYPDLFAAVAVHSGLAYSSATNVASAFEAMAHARGSADALGLAAHAAMGEHARPIPSIVIHGNADRTVAPANATHLLRHWMTTNHLAAPEICDHDVARPSTTRRAQVAGGHTYTQSRWIDERGTLMHELLEVDGLGHAWSGGVAGGSYTDPRGPSATEAIWEFFAQTASSPPCGRAPASAITSIQGR